MAVIATLAYVLSRFRAFRRFLRRAATRKEKLLLTLFFGLLAIAGTYLGIPIHGAIANSRVIGAAIAGLLGGPWVGLAAGLIGGGHRYFVGGFTALACGVSTTVEGLLAGLVYQFWPGYRTRWTVGFAVGFLDEVIQMLIILLLARPFPAAWTLVKAIALPMTLVNAAGMAVFISIVEDAENREERLGAVQTHKVLGIVRETLPHLRKGLDQRSAQAVARIIYEVSEAAAVAISDRESILAHVGAGLEQNRPGNLLAPELVRQVIARGGVLISENRRQLNCGQVGCPFGSSITVPLRSRQGVLGSLTIYHREEEAVTAVDRELVLGMSHLLQTQLELAELERKAQLATRAELKALQAQVNPHFLFNALNTIVSLSRDRPEEARRLTINLSEYFRRNLSQNRDFVGLKEELEHVKAYLAIEKARFEERLKVIMDVDPALQRLQIPPLILQPIVENAVKHGLLPKKEGGTVWITARLLDNRVRITVRDDGVGLNYRRRTAAPREGEPGARVGLRNVQERLKNLYGPQAGLRMTPGDEGGVRVDIFLPAEFLPRGTERKGPAWPSERRWSTMNRRREGN